MIKLLLISLLANGIIDIPHVKLYYDQRYSVSRQGVFNRKGDDIIQEETYKEITDSTEVSGFISSVESMIPNDLSVNEIPGMDVAFVALMYHDNIVDTLEISNNPPDGCKFNGKYFKSYPLYFFIIEEIAKHDIYWERYQRTINGCDFIFIYRNHDGSLIENPKVPSEKEYYDLFFNYIF